jgi:hypothetical protein
VCSSDLEERSAAARRAVAAAPQIPYTLFHQLEVRTAFRLQVGRRHLTESEAAAVLSQLEDDVAVRLERERRKRGVPFKELVNQVLRSGLDHLDAPQRAREPFRTEGLALGQSRVGSLDNIEEVLSRTEGEGHQ